MKALRTLLTAITLGLLIAFSGCGPKGGSTETVQDKQLGLLSKTWKVSTVNYAGVDSTVHWTNFHLTISGTKGATSFNYSCTGKPYVSVWPLSGTFSFDTTTPTTLVTRNEDGLKITYSVDPASTALTLSFNYTSSTYYKYNQRLNNLGGNWTFNLIPQ